MDSAYELPHERDSRLIGLLVGVDFGRKRIGLAVTDLEQRVSMPADVLPGRASSGEAASAVAAWGRARRAAGYIVGLPINMDGSLGRQAEITREFAARLAEASALPIRLVDERLTSFQADQWLADAGRPRRRGGKSPARDALAALAILQTYLSKWKTSAPESPTSDDGGD